MHPRASTRHQVPRAIVRAFAVIASLSSGCSCDGSAKEALLGHLDPDDDHEFPPGRAPFRDAWRVEAEVEFPYLDADQMPQIVDLTIGGRLANDNFANRGDVIVQFVEQGEPYSIVVELRRFTTNTDEAQAVEDFAALDLWAFNADVAAPRQPDDMDPASDCTAARWLDGCGIRVSYDGLNQLERAGADIRVTLPAAYRHHVTVVTEDDDADADYLNRGNVCVDGLAGSLDVELESGEAYVILAEHLTPAPQCPAAQVEACDAWVDEAGEPAAWHPSCPCALDGAFGTTRVGTSPDAAANIRVDLPSGLWSAIAIENLDEAQDPEDPCQIAITVPDVVHDAIGPWHARGRVGRPGDAAVAGGGYAIDATSEACRAVRSTEDPDHFVGVDEGDAQASQRHGDIEVCSGCLRGSTCAALLP